MLKFLIILVLVVYLFYKVGTFLLRVLFIGASQQQRQQYQSNQNHRRQSKPPGSNLQVDYVPEDKDRKSKNKDGYQGGQYVDFEEVKD